VTGGVPHAIMGLAVGELAFSRGSLFRQILVPITIMPSHLLEILAKPDSFLNNGLLGVINQQGKLSGGAVTDVELRRNQPSQNEDHRDPPVISDEKPFGFVQQPYLLGEGIWMERDERRGFLGGERSGVGLVAFRSPDPIASLLVRYPVYVKRMSVTSSESRDQLTSSEHCIHDAPVNHRRHGEYGL